MLFEAEDLKMATIAIELNTFVDTILSSVFKASTLSRPIVFSSFSPEICIFLSLKQARYPILFLSDGIFPVGDIRASSMLEAVRFSKAWDLSGVVMESTPLVLAPRLIRFVKDMGLVCASYGSLNDDPRCAKVSRKEETENKKEKLNKIFLEPSISLDRGLGKNVS
jgi:glycerophosphodiester phosphodiesterase